MNPFAEYNATDVLWLGDWSPGWIALLVVLGAVVIGVSIYDLAPLRPARRWTLVGLRAAVYALAVMLLLEPAVDLKNITKVKNHVAILLDASASMALEQGGSSRWARATEAARELDLPDELQDDNHVYDLFLFGDELTPTTMAALNTVRPEQRATDIAGALESLRQRYERVDIGGIVLITDGTDTAAIGERTRRDEELDTASAELVRSLGAPLHTIGVASPDDLVDVAITRVMRDDFAFVHNKVSVEVELQAFGLEPTSFPVKLIRDGQLLQTRDVTIVDGKSTYEVSFDYVPKAIGKEIYTIEAPEFTGEVLLTNNRVHFLQKIIRDKVRALQVVGRPSWDERFLRRLLKRNPNVDLISFFILRTDQNVQVAPNSELSLIPFPTEELFEEELGSFDVVIFQNFNFAPYNMRQYLPRIAEFVKSGGGFAMVGGDLSFGSGGYGQTPIEEVLPVELPPSNAANLIDESLFRPVLTDAGQRHPITQLAFDPASNSRIWAALPEQRGTNLVGAARPQATVLAHHPSIRVGSDPMPVLAVSEVGDGRVMALTTDSTWRWGLEHLGSGGTPREYQVFWNSAIRWLIKDPELKLLRVEIGADEYSPRDVLTASVRVQKADYTPAANVEGKFLVAHRSFDALLDRGRDERRVVREVAFVTDADGVAALEVPVDEVGVWTVTARAQTASGDLRDDDVALAVSSAVELRDALPRPDLLEQLARAGGGRAETAEGVLTSLPFDEPRTVRVNRRQVIQLWDSFWVFALILALLGTEWTLRRRWGRL